MLEQAIVDAAALKEAALKNAETQILEKYAPEIKDAVDRLLNEAPEDEELGLEPEEPGVENPMGGDEEAAVSDLDAPPSYAEGEKLCPCPDEEEKIELDLDQLAAAVAAEEEAGGMGAVAQEPREDAMMALEEGEEEESIDLTEEQLAAILQELTEEVKTTVDIEVVPNGHPGDATRREVEEASEMEAAKEVDSDLEEELDGMRKSKKDLEEQVAALTADKKKLAEEYNELKSIAMKMKDNLEEVNLSNAKLVYTNRVLNSVSLNERQKNKIVEALSNSRTVEEVKVIYETLQSTVGSAPTKRGPESLSEAISRKSTTLPRRKTQKTVGSEHAVNRMQRLAGIK
tara:strand:+ start:12656 stop:13687 length:1032 start_codon:yes stop_codon:yes gene_type:complete